MPRRIRIGEETVVAEFVDVAHWLFGHYGFIAGPRFSGRTTFLKAMVFQVLSTERRNLVYYLRAPEFCEAAEKKTPVFEFIAEITLSERDGGSGLHNKLVDDLEALDREGRLLLLVDDLELLNEYQQRRMIVQLSPCRSVFFSITPEWKKFITSELKRSRLEGPPLNVELLELDDAFLERLAASLYHSAGLDRPVELVPQLLASNVTDLASVPLGILALLQCQREKHGLFAGSVALVALSEWMRRAGYDRLVLPAQAEDLQMPAAAICQLGAAIYHFWASIDFLVSDRASLRGGLDRSTFWIPWEFLQRDFCGQPLSSEKLLNLRLLEVAPDKSAARFIYQEFEPLAGGLFAYYYPDQIRTGPFAPFRSGWAGDVLQQIIEIQRLVPMLRDITLQLSKEG
jgi:hypothetical protein